VRDSRRRAGGTTGAKLLDDVQKIQEAATKRIGSRAVETDTALVAMLFDAEGAPDRAPAAARQAAAAPTAGSSPPAGADPRCQIATHGVRLALAHETLARELGQPAVDFIGTTTGDPSGPVKDTWSVLP
jgi:hypothetical protein